MWSLAPFPPNMIITTISPLLFRVTRRTGSCPKFRKEASGSRLLKHRNQSANPIRNPLIWMKVIPDQRILSRNKQKSFFFTITKNHSGESHIIENRDFLPQCFPIKKSTDCPWYNGDDPYSLFFSCWKKTGKASNTIFYILAFQKDQFILCPASFVLFTSLITFAGTPAAMTEPSPMVTPGRTVTLAPGHTFFPINQLHFPQRISGFYQME